MSSFLEIFEVLVEEIAQRRLPPKRRPWDPAHEQVAADAKAGAQKCWKAANPQHARAVLAKGMRRVRAGKRARGICKDCPVAVSRRPNGSLPCRCSSCAEAHSKRERAARAQTGGAL